MIPVPVLGLSIRATILPRAAWDVGRHFVEGPLEVHQGQCLPFGRSASSNWARPLTRFRDV